VPAFFLALIVVSESATAQAPEPFNFYKKFTPIVMAAR